MANNKTCKNSVLVNLRETFNAFLMKGRIGTIDFDVQTHTTATWIVAGVSSYVGVCCSGTKAKN